MGILSADNLDRGFLNNFAKNVLAKLTNLKISNFKEKLSELLKENFSVSDDLEINYESKIYKLNFVVSDETKFFIPYGMPLMGSPIFPVEKFHLLEKETFIIEKSLNNRYSTKEDDKINLIIILKTKFMIYSNHIFEFPINLKESDLGEDLLSALLKVELEK